MERISMDIARMKNHYTVVVVGSGYGGGVAASRMSRAKQSVCVLERGKEMVPGQYPNSLIDASAQVQIDSPQEHIGNPTGLYDFRLNPEGISVFSGCGLGGTSLINANVSLRAELRVFQDQKWPAPIREEADRIASGNDTGTLLAKGYELAEEMLRPVPIRIPGPRCQSFLRWSMHRSE